ncbi:uncharacterized protein LOC124273647 [Haliotis rubra]|uniref:uncharacterized protein LOC124273647 n=1 Tax=Haliotis rubra TaxID=36100 RepID=UPI001EE52654|nr:uncharacterized protein LOC124273647 [Haliotis rubra]XP_046564877.1 uncharacterized protein LOC124273647 [Haliotis rubra]
MASASEKDTTLSALMKISTASDIKNDRVICASSSINWEEIIGPAPMSIALLGQLMLISGGTDFTLVTGKRPDSSFVRLRYPDSMNACLVQVSNEGWEAFNTAHSNMEKIHLITNQIPGHARNAVQILLKGSPEELKLALPIPLKRIQLAAKQCTAHAEEVQKQFVDVMATIGELLEACTAAKGDYEDKLKQTKAAVAAAKRAETQIKEQKTKADEELAHMTKALKDREEDYKKALDDMPGALQLMGMKFFDRYSGAVLMSIQAELNPMMEIPQAIGTGVKVLTPVVGGVSDLLKSKTEAVPTQHDNPLGERERETIEYIKSIKLKITLIISLLPKYLESFEDKNRQEGTVRDVKEYLVDNKADLDRFTKTLKNKFDVPTKPMMLSLLQDLTTLMDSMIDFSKQMGQNPEMITEFRQKLDKVKHTMECVEMTDMRAGHPLAQAPQAAKAQQNSLELEDKIIDQARFKAEKTSQMLKTAEARYDEVNQRAQRKNDELMKLVEELSQMDAKEIDFNKIRETLTRGIKALGEVRKQWGRLVTFFQRMSNVIQCSLGPTLDTFTETANVGRELQLNYSFSKLMQDTLYSQAVQASEISYVVHEVSGTYVDISRDHLMDKISSLGELIALNPETESHLIKLKHIELMKGARKAQQAIQEKVEERQLDMHERVQARLSQIERGMQAALPPPNPERELQMQRMRAIAQDQREKVVAAAQAEAEEEEMSQFAI